MWTSRLRRAWMAKLPPDKLLPDRQPAYVASWIYVFGVLTLAAFLVILSRVSCSPSPDLPGTTRRRWAIFTNSLHFWSVQLFFVFMVIHLWGKFWMAAWRGRRAMTWITGVVAFLASIGTAFTGYLVQTNFDSQWISFEAKDGLNAVGIGAFFNVTNLGQMLLLHACLLPLVVGVDRGVARAAGPPPRCRPAHRRRRRRCRRPQLDADPEGGRGHEHADQHRSRSTSPPRSGRARGGATTSSRRASSPSLSSAS